MRFLSGCPRSQYWAGHIQIVQNKIYNFCNLVYNPSRVAVGYPRASNIYNVSLSVLVGGK